MHAVSHYYSMFHSRIPYPIKVGLNVLATPFAFVGTVIASVRGQTKKNHIWQMSTEELAGSFSFEIEKGNPNRDALIPVQAALKTQINAKDWLAVSDLIVELDRARISLPSGTRLIRPLLNGVWKSSLLQVKPDCDFEACEPLLPGTLPDSHIANFTSAAQIHSDHVGMQCLAAWMHLEMAWIRRGGEYANFTSDAAFQGFEHHTKAAHALIKDIDAQGVDSPLVAEICYRCVAAGGGTELADLKAAHAKWIALDPTDMGAFSLHGMFLLPRCYGSYDALADAAQSAYAAHHADTGLASYAATYLGAIGMDQIAMIGLNPLQLQDGLLDMTTRAKNPSAALNAVCAHLSGICTTSYSVTGKGEEKEIIVRNKALKAILKKFIRSGMGTVTPAIWTPQWSEIEVPYLLAEAFEVEIMAGQHVHLDHNGATFSQA